MMNEKIAKKIRDPHCTKCVMSNDTEVVCQVGMGPRRAQIMVVGKMPNSGRHQESLEKDLIDVGLDPSQMYFTSVLKCRNFETNATKLHQNACAPYLMEEIDLVQPEWILSMGNEALQVLTKHSGIMKYRGRVVEQGDLRIFPTISASAVGRNPGQRPGYIADLKLFASEIAGVGSKIPTMRYATIDDKKKLKWLTRQLDASELLSYDVETFSTPAGNEWAPDARIVSLSGTMLVKGKIVVWALPLYHPESPWRQNWRGVLKTLAPHLERVPKQIAQNGKYDCRWLRTFGVNMRVTFDTMLAVHLLDENMPKSLKVQALVRLGVRPWAIDTKSLLSTPIREVLQYNALDTYYTYYLYLEAKKELLAQPRLTRIFLKLMLPANEILIDVERRGVWVDREMLATNSKIAFDTRAYIDEQLMEYVPDLNEMGAIDGNVALQEALDLGWPTSSKNKLMPVNFNPSKFLRWLLFDHLGLPILKRGKEKEDGRPGDPSVAEDVMLELRMNHHHPIIDLLMERSKWQKYCSSFLDSYGELLDEKDRIHTTFKLYGTVTGRLSSGKSEADKVTARAPIRGVNLQQVPRDPFIRSLFGSAPGYTFVEADFSQVELRVAAFLSRDETMRHLYQTNQDIHRATAAWVLGIPAEAVSKDDRKKAKAINFGFVYGMGAKKFVYTAFTKYDVVFSLREAEDIRKSFFSMYTGLLPWHARQRRLVQEYRRVQSPLGRIRHLPDIDSDDRMVRGEAERQAINSPVQSFASDMTMLSMILIQEKFRKKGWDAHFISTVHDALLFEVRDDLVPKALPLIKWTMENLPLDTMFGVDLDVPIVSDLKVGRNWGTAREIEEAEVYDYQGGVTE